MNYEIIKDLTELESFVDWLPELEVNERYYITLFARRKYDPSVKEDRRSLKRVISTKDLIIKKIRQMETAVGTYYSQGVPLSQEALTIYITTNPRCLRKATFKTLIAMANKAEENKPGFNPYSETMTQIHKSKSRSEFITLDIDGASEEQFDKTIEFMKQLLGVQCLNAIKTHGGYHIPIRLSSIDSLHKNWYPILFKFIHVDQKGDLLSPIPGCTQGGFVPKMLLKNGEA